MIVTDLSTSYNPVPKSERKKDKKLINAKKHNCEYCGKENCYTNTHHIRSKGAGGDDTKDNLIELCGDCHLKAHSGVISKEDLYKIVKRRKKQVLKRDDYTCQKCGTKENLVVHHKERFSENKELRFDIANGITLCQKCHKEVHKNER